MNIKEVLKMIGPSLVLLAVLLLFGGFNDWAQNRAQPMQVAQQAVGGPVADAGPDQSIEDTDADGFEAVSLDASGSTDDGTIDSYEWILNTIPVATGETPSIDLSLGEYTIVLTVTDNDGNTDTDTVVIVVQSVGGPTPTTVPTSAPTATPTNTPAPTLTPTATATNVPAATTTPTPGLPPWPAYEDCERAYSDDSIWNNKIKWDEWNIHPNSDNMVQEIFTGTNETKEWINTNPANKVPIYFVDNSTPLVDVQLTNSYRDSVEEVYEGGILVEVREVLNVRDPGSLQQLPIPAGAVPAGSGDQELTVVNTDTGYEYNMRGVSNNGDGTYNALTVAEYHLSFDGVPPKNYQFRGADSTSLGGIPRECEFAEVAVEARDYIDHALTIEYVSPMDPDFAYNNGMLPWIPPWTDSDGDGTLFNDIPEGAQIAIRNDIDISQIEFACIGGSGTVNPACVTWVRTMQEYGAFLIDFSNIHPISRLEGDITADWSGNGWDVEDMLENIPQSWYVVIDWQHREGWAHGFDD